MCVCVQFCGREHRYIALFQFTLFLCVCVCVCVCVRESVCVRGCSFVDVLSYQCLRISLDKVLGNKSILFM